MNARHALPDPDGADQRAVFSRLPRSAIEGHLRSLRLVMAAVNASTAVGLAINRAGTSPAFGLMEQYMPLPVWAAGFGLVAALLTATMLGLHTATGGHLLGVVLWAVPAVGAVYGLLSGTTTSPTASVVLASMIVGMATHHVLALMFLRRQAG